MLIHCIGLLWLKINRKDKALVSMALGMKEHEERNSENQSFSKDKSSTFGSNNEHFEKHRNQQAKRCKMKNEKRLINCSQYNSSK